ncbi:MAG: hypothetical protein D6796_15955 [Caldilineae bacterium]|nr:MAG: hypothetical protein D6796_15955 [Caldilineae bacterium]
MDAGELTVLKADIRAQMTMIEATLNRLKERSRGEWGDDLARMESVAYQIHNLYNAVEDLLELVAAFFENHMTDPSRRHTELLRRMTYEIPGVRPALLSEDSFLLLNSLRGFRHFFRHAYSIPLERDLLQINLQKAFRLYPQLTQDVEHFLQQLTAQSGEGLDAGR